MTFSHSVRYENMKIQQGQPHYSNAITLELYGRTNTTHWQSRTKATAGIGTSEVISGRYLNLNLPHETRFLLGWTSLMPITDNSDLLQKQVSSAEFCQFVHTLYFVWVILFIW